MNRHVASSIEAFCDNILPGRASLVQHKPNEHNYRMINRDSLLLLQIVSRSKAARS